MFSLFSRYSTLPDMVATNAYGRMLASKSPRLVPQVSGTLRHTVHEADRLDHLTLMYDQQPHKWWRISDTNAVAFLSPQAFLEKDLVVTDRFAVTTTQTPSPWEALVQDLTRRVGVESAKVEEAVRVMPATQTLDGQTMTAQVKRITPAVVVTYNQMHLSPGDIASIIASHGISVGAPESIGRVGKQIMIPPDFVA